MMWTMEVRTHFSAAHRLTRGAEPIEPLHGHSYRVDVILELPPELDQSGITVDFHEAQRVLQAIVQELNFTNLNEHPAFLASSPSAENIARYIAARFKERWQQRGRLAAVRVWEEPDRNITYYPDAATGWRP